MAAPDFKGYATKAGLKCSDGRTITAQAFKHMDGEQVPLVWMHGHTNPENVLGHVLLQHREDGMYCEGFFNESPAAQHIRHAVENKDIKSLSIWANELKEQSKRVMHGQICEVSLVIKGANPGAFIDFVSIKHADGDIENFNDVAIIYSGAWLEHSDEDEELEHADSEETVEDVYNSMSPKQQAVLKFMVGLAADAVSEDDTAAHSGTEEDDDEDDSDDEDASETEDDNTSEDNLGHQEGNTEVRNIFDRTDADNGNKRERRYLSESDRKAIAHDAMHGVGSLKKAMEGYCLAHGIDDIDLLFPDARAIDASPQMDTRRMEWVADVMGSVHHTPFSRIKSLVADLTLEQARAKGYVKGSLKKEQWFRLSKRTTTPTTVYKKQKLDRDDVIDITDYDVVAWIKAEMQMMLKEEVARAILIGDGRAVDDPDKVKDPVGAQDGAGIRSIINDDDLYAPTLYVNIDDASSSYQEVLDAVIRGRRFYKGSGTPTFYTTDAVISSLTLLKDTTGRTLYPTLQELANVLRVSKIVAVEPMEDETDVLGIIVNLVDYNVGTDRGGEISMFDDFDIDYNQLKYLTETRASGALTKIRAALVIRKVPSGAALVVPVSPTQDDDEVTVVTTTGVTHKIGAFSGAVTYNGSPVAADQTVTASFPVILPSGGSVTIYAVPASSSYFFANTVEDEWTFTN